jgi:hypothetical protein
MKKHATAIMMTLYCVFGWGTLAADAQFPIKIPKIKVEKPKPEQTAPAGNAETSGVETSNGQTSSGGGFEVLSPPNADSTPRFLRDSVEISVRNESRYWKFPKQDHYHSWIPTVSFDLFFDNSVSLRYNAEWTKPDGTPWFTEPLRFGTGGADQTVRVSSAFSQEFDKVSTATTGTYGVKIVNTKNNETIFQGKFKIGKMALFAGDPRYKNAFLFYVDNDWLLPTGYVGFQYNDSFESALKPNIYTWFKGNLDGKDMEARLYFGDQEVASTDEGGSIIPLIKRGEGCYEKPEVCSYNLWLFNWDKFMIENEKSQRERFTKTTFTRDKPGEYTAKIFHRGTQVREMKFTIDKKGWIARNAFSDQMYLTVFKIAVPVKVMGTVEKWNSATPKADAYYGNPLSGF